MGLMNFCDEYQISVLLIFPVLQVIKFMQNFDQLLKEFCYWSNCRLSDCSIRVSLCVWANCHFGKDYSYCFCLQGGVELARELFI